MIDQEMMRDEEPFDEFAGVYQKFVEGVVLELIEKPYFQIKLAEAVDKGRIRINSA